MANKVLELVNHIEDQTLAVDTLNGYSNTALVTVGGVEVHLPVHALMKVVIDHRANTTAKLNLAIK